MPAQINGAAVVILTRPADSYKLTDQPSIIDLMKEMSKAGVKLIIKPNIHQKFAVIDRNVVWYGSINFLSYGSAEESIMRFENKDIAGELLEVIE